MAAAATALILYYAFSGDMQWYGWFTIAASTVVLSCAAASFFNNHKEKKREREYRRGRIRKSIREAEAVFRRMSALSNDYDFMDEDAASQKIAAYARRNAEILGQCKSEIEGQIRHMNGRDSTIKEVDGVADVLRWFDRLYVCRGSEPSAEQRRAWNNDRHQIDGRLDRLSEALRVLASA